MRTIRASIAAGVAVVLTAFAAAREPEACIIDTIAGGSSQVLGDGGPALDADLIDAVDLRQAPDGSLWVSDAGQHAIRRIGPDGIIRTMVGTGRRGFSGDGGPGSAAQINQPGSMAFAKDGTLYFYDAGNLRIRRVDSSGVISTVVGNGESRLSIEEGAGLATGLEGAVTLALEASGELVFTVSGHHRIRRLNRDGTVASIAGAGSPDRSTGAFSGDGGPALRAELDRPSDIATTPDGSIYFVDSAGQRIRRIDSSGSIGSPFERAFGGVEIEIDPNGALFWEQDGAVEKALADSAGEVVFAPEMRAQTDTRFAILPEAGMYLIRDYRVLRLLDESLELKAGAGPAMGVGDDGPATLARLPFVNSTAIGPNGEVYLADSTLGRVRVIGHDGVIRPFAGTGERGKANFDGPALSAKLPGANNIAVGSDGSVYIASANWVGRVDPSGILTTIAGAANASRCAEESCGDGGPAVAVHVPDIRSLAVDREGNVYIRHFHRAVSGFWLRRIGSDGIVTTLPAEPLAASSARSATSITTGSDGYLVVSIEDGSNWRYHPEEGWSPIEVFNGYVGAAVSLAPAPQRGLLFTSTVLSPQIKLATADGRVTVIAGQAVHGSSGDGGPAGQASLTSPWALSAGA